MKKTIALATLVAVSGLAHGQSLVIDISMYDSYNFQGDPQNDIANVFIAASASITNIAWDVTISTESPSWLEEFTMGFFGNSEIVQVAPGDAFTGSFVNYVGDQASSIVLGADGMLDIEFYEQFFDDIPGGIDTYIEAGSTITVSYIPAPSALAVLGLGGLVAGRRRR